MFPLSKNIYTQMHSSQYYSCWLQGFGDTNIIILCCILLKFIKKTLDDVQHWVATCLYMVVHRAWATLPCEITKQSGSRTTLSLTSEVSKNEKKINFSIGPIHFIIRLIPNNIIPHFTTKSNLKLVNLTQLVYLFCFRNC
jgi:hypothetical protein